MTKKRTKAPMTPDAAREIGEINKLTDDELRAAGHAQYEADPKYRDVLDAENQMQYETTNDPLWAWHAYFLARETKQTIPEWVLIYLDSVANGLLNKKNQLADCALHLGFNLKDGGSSPFNRGFDASIRTIAKLDVGQLLATNQEMRVEDGCKKIADDLRKIRGVDVDTMTVKKWYYKNP